MKIKVLRRVWSKVCVCIGWYCQKNPQSLFWSNVPVEMSNPQTLTHSHTQSVNSTRPLVSVSPSRVNVNKAALYFPLLTAHYVIFICVSRLLQFCFHSCLFLCLFISRICREALNISALKTVCRGRYYILVHLQCRYVGIFSWMSFYGNKVWMLIHLWSWGVGADTQAAGLLGLGRCDVCDVCDHCVTKAQLRWYEIMDAGCLGSGEKKKLFITGWRHNHENIDTTGCELFSYSGLRQVEFLHLFFFPNHWATSSQTKNKVDVQLRLDELCFVEWSAS